VGVSEGLDGRANSRKSLSKCNSNSITVNKITQIDKNKKAKTGAYRSKTAKNATILLAFV